MRNLGDEYKRDELLVALELDGEAVQDLIMRKFDLAYTYVCEVGSAEENAKMKPGAHAMRWSGHFDPRLLATQILELLVDRRIDRAAFLMREVQGE